MKYLIIYSKKVFYLNIWAFRGSKCYEELKGNKKEYGNFINEIKSEEYKWFWITLL